MAGHGHKLSVVPACGQVLAAANNNTTNWIWFYNNGWSHTAATPRPGQVNGSISTQYLLNKSVLSKLEHSWVRCDACRVQSLLWHEDCGNKQSKYLPLFAEMCITKAAIHSCYLGCWRRKVSYEHSRGLFNCGLIVLRKEERVESL